MPDADPKQSKSSKTTKAGWIALGSAILVAAAAFIDGNPETAPNFAKVIDAFLATGVLGMGWAAKILGKNARDWDVSSQDEGIRKPGDEPLTGSTPAS